MATIDPTRGWVSPTGNHYWYRKRREAGELLARNAKLAAGATVVDLGAGSGEDLPLLASLYPDAEIVAVDAADHHLQALAERFADTPNMRTERADITQRLPFADGSVELVYCSEVVEHIPDPGALFAEVYRVLGPHGFFLMTTKNEPNVLQKSFWLRRRLTPATLGGNTGEGGAGQGVELHGHVTLFKIKEWEELLSRSGLELVQARRGALMYGARRWLDSEPMLALYFAAEAVVDLLPMHLARRISDQLIGLYRKV